MATETGAGNARHRAALASTAERVDELRVDLHAVLAELRKLLGQLDDLAGTRQSMGLGFQTPQSRAARAKQDAADRTAMRSAIPPRGASLGHAWMNTPAGAVPGVHEAPVTMPAVSVSAEVLFALQHHVRRLGRAVMPGIAAEDLVEHGEWLAARAAWEAYERARQDRIRRERHRGLCDWPSTRMPAKLPPPEPAGRHPLVRHPITTDAPAAELTQHLERLVDAYPERPGLEALLRDLEHLERQARDVVHGPARTNHPSPCPWCGRNTLVIHHRAKGRDTAFIRCEGTHPCECRDQWCACHLHPVRHRHEWANSGRASKNWQTLARDQDHRREQEVLETKALDAVARALALHAETPVYPWAEDCPTPAKHAPGFQEPTDLNSDPAANLELICTECIPISTVCVHCRDDAGDYHPYPCPTAQALDLEQTTTPTQE